MPRPMKFEPGDVAHVDDGGWVVVVDYKQDTKGRGEYRVIRLSNPLNGYLHGPPHYIKSYKLSQTAFVYKRAVSNYRNNEAIGTTAERGCRCQCCIHTALPPSMVKADGTYVGDDIELP